jgi:hypothetical protein
METDQTVASYWRYESDDDDLDVNNRIPVTQDPEDEEEDEILEMDFQSSYERNPSGETFEESYMAKCGGHQRPSLRWRLCQGDDEAELSESDRKMVRAAIGSVRSDHVRCNCLNLHCKIVRYLKSQKESSTTTLTPTAETVKINDLNQTTTTAMSQQHFQIAKEDFRRVHEELICLAGGKEKAEKVYQKICQLAKGQTRVDSKSTCNTALMQLCSTTFKDESDPNRCNERNMLYAQIYSITKLYMDLDPEALFVRNTQDAGALELAALTNKVVVAKYLVMLHTIYGRDVNAPNQRGHTLLHLLARKGDDCADTLEALLAVRVVSEDKLESRRLLRMDVLNDGKKTPLDVATACVDLFSIGKDRTIFTKVIAIFHGAIEEEARQLVGGIQQQQQQQQQQHHQHHQHKNGLTFRNDF